MRLLPKAFLPLTGRNQSHFRAGRGQIKALCVAAATCFALDDGGGDGPSLQGASEHNQRVQKSVGLRRLDTGVASRIDIPSNAVYLEGTCAR